MALLLLGAFLVVVGFLSWVTYRGQGRVASCCAPADPCEDLRMQGTCTQEPD